MTHVNPTNDHDSVAALLPWYVNDTLGTGEREFVRGHIKDCAECRRDVDMLSQVQQVVRRDSPAPLVPSPRVDDLLRAVDDATVERRRPISWRSLSIAASVLVGALVLVFLIETQIESDTVNEFQTVTSTAATGSLDYVIELTFVPGTDSSERDELFNEFRFVGAAVGADTDAYRVTVSLDALSLEELERYINEVESSPVVAAARVVAVQLPVE